MLAKSNIQHILAKSCILLFASLLIFLTRFIVINTNFYFDFDHIFKLQFGPFCFIMAALLSYMSWFYLSILISQKYAISSEGILFKLSRYLLPPLLMVPFIYILGLDNILWPLTAFYFIVLLLLDLFLESQKASITWLVVWMIMFSLIITASLFYFNSGKEIKLRTAAVESYLNEPKENDVLNIKAIQKSLVESQLFQSDLSQFERESIKQEVVSIIAKSHPSIENIDVLKLCYFDLDGKSYFHPVENSSLYYFSNSFYTETIDENLFFNGIDNNYILRLPIEREINSGYVFIVISTNTNSKDQTNTERFNLHVYDGSKILDAPKLSFDINKNRLALLQERGDVSIFNQNELSHIYHKNANGSYTVSLKPIARLIKPISLFSYIFTLLGLMLLILALLNTRFQFLKEMLNLNLGQLSSLKSKLQLALIALTIFSFIIIGIVTIFYFNNLSGRFQNSLIIEKANSISQSIKNNGSGKNQIRTEDQLKDELHNLAFDQNLDLFILDDQFEIIKSSFDKGGFIIKDIAKKDLSTNNQLFAKTIEWNENNFPAALIPLSNNDEFSGYLGVMDLNDTNQLNNLNDFIGTLLNVYVFLFLIAGALAFFVANSITKPIAVLGDVLKRFKLGKKNEPLEWKGKDELGALINEYNALVVKLDESAKMIAKTERDTAWREMAQQVAHEIKNPLTPMKLSIQYLQRAINSNPSEAEKLINRVSSTLIEQIENLSEIAGAFSNFGQMPKANNQKVVINEIVEAIHDLFRKREDMDINLFVPIDDVFVFADRNQLIRILNNIVKNAIQAIPKDRRGKIDIILEKKENLAIIKISDNGTGISDEMKSKVFTPNFTTKTSGTGLGLAMSANMIESFNGKIFFETQIDKGTDFYIELPLMHVNDNYRNENRVSLY